MILHMRAAAAAAAAGEATILLSVRAACRRLCVVRISHLSR